MSKDSSGLRMPTPVPPLDSDQFEIGAEGAPAVWIAPSARRVMRNCRIAVEILEARRKTGRRETSS